MTTSVLYHTNVRLCMKFIFFSLFLKYLYLMMIRMSHWKRNLGVRPKLIWFLQAEFTTSFLFTYRVVSSNPAFRVTG